MNQIGNVMVTHVHRIHHTSGIGCHKQSNTLFVKGNSSSLCAHGGV